MSSNSHQNPSPSDDEVVVEVQNGDVERFRVLIERHRDGIFSLILRQVADRAIAEEIAQEVFVRAFRSIGSFRRESQFSTWLIRIAMNRTHSWFSSSEYRKQKRAVQFDPHLHGSSTEERENAAAFTHQVQRAIGLLSPTLREALVLAALEGKSYDECAVILDIPIGTVRSRLNAARLKLKEILRKEEE